MSALENRAWAAKAIQMTRKGRESGAWTGRNGGNGAI
jgi:hypothetical protein